MISLHSLWQVRILLWFFYIYIYMYNGVFICIFPGTKFYVLDLLSVFISKVVKSILK
jgi:hypothetical protein